MKHKLRLCAAAAALYIAILSPKPALAADFSASDNLTFALAWSQCGSGDTVVISGPVSIGSGLFGTLDKAIRIDSGGSLSLSSGEYLVTGAIGGTVGGGSGVSVFVRGGSISLSGGSVFVPVSSVVSGVADVTGVKYSDGTSESVTSFHGSSWLSASGKTLAQVRAASGTYRKNAAGAWAKVCSITYQIDPAKGTNDARNPTEYLSGDGPLTIYPPAATAGNVFESWSLSGVIAPDDPTQPAVIPTDVMTGDLVLTAQFAAGGAMGSGMGNRSTPAMAAFRYGGGGASGASAASDDSGADEAETSAQSAGTDETAAGGRGVRQARSGATVTFAEGYSDADMALPTPESAKKNASVLWLLIGLGAAAVGIAAILIRIGAARAKEEEERFGL